MFFASNRYWLLFLLTSAYVLSFVDRHVMAVLVKPIQQDFIINDMQYALLNGLAFSLLYTTLALPIGYFADRKNRKTIIAVGIAFWSAMTFACGLAAGFVTLFLARMGVGVGEASLSPPSHSLLSDYFSKKSLPVAMAIFTLGIPVGIGIAFSLGGWAYGFFEKSNGIELALLGHVNAWQATFMLVSLPGVVIALLLLLIKEPVRKNVVTDDSGAAKVFDFKESVTYIKQHSGVYWNVFAGISAVALIAYSHLSWFVAHLTRIFDLPVQEITPIYGLINLVFGIAGTLIGAVWVKWLSKNNAVDAGLRITLYFILLLVIPYVLSPLMTSLTMAYVMVSLCTICFNGYFGVAIAALQTVTPNQLRAQVSALLLFSGNVAGLMIGPVVVGFLSDHVFTGKESLGYALSTIGVVFGPLAAWLIYKSLRPYCLLLD